MNEFVIFPMASRSVKTGINRGINDSQLIFLSSCAWHLLVEQTTINYTIITLFALRQWIIVPGFIYTSHISTPLRSAASLSFVVGINSCAT